MNNKISILGCAFLVLSTHSFADKLECVGCVNQVDVAKGAITSGKIKNLSIKREDFAKGQVVKQINGLSDNVKIEGGNGIQVSTKAKTKTITIGNTLNKSVKTLSNAIQVGSEDIMFSLDTDELMRLSKQQRLELYANLYLTGSKNEALQGIGSTVSWHSQFPNSADNRHLYMSLGDTVNTSHTEQNDFVIHSWNSNFDSNSHVKHLVLDADGTVEVPNYIKLATTGGAVPPTSDCNEAHERGRMKVNELHNILYICMQSGWVTK